jgi:hypothetical protein
MEQLNFTDWRKNAGGDNKEHDPAENSLNNFNAGRKIDFTVYTAGAYLRPFKTTGNDGREKWIWAVSEFNDDTFFHGEYCNPVETAEAENGLLISDEE